MRDHARGHEARFLPLVVLFGLAIATACLDPSTAPTAAPASLQMHAITPATVRTLVVQVSGPGIDSVQLVNIPVNAEGVASGTVETTAGSGRRIVVTAVDTAGTTTHRGDTTVTLAPGPNPPLSLVLRPLRASLGITVSFGHVRVINSRNEEANP